MLDAIAGTLALARATIPFPNRLPASLDIVAAEDLELHALAAPTRLLAERLVSDLVADRHEPLLDGAESAALGEVRTALDAAALRMKRGRRDAALGDTAALIREIGLERHDLDCHLATGADGTPVIVAAPIPRATAYVWLIGRLFERAEIFVLGDEFLVVGRAASAWYFGRWSAGTWHGDREHIGFTRRVREQEWSLVSRDTLALGEPVMASLIGDERFADIPERQQHLARAMQRSIVDVFEIERIDGNLMTVRSVRDGRTYRVHEHNEEDHPFAGMVLLGRLIPLERDLWLRSPGAVMISSESDTYRDLLAEGLTRTSESMPAPIALEALLSAAVFGARLPVSKKPAPSAAQARAMLTRLDEDLEDLGLREKIPLEEAPAELVEAVGASETEFVTYSLDQAMAEWMEALTAQATAGSQSGRGASRAAKGGKRNHKGRKKKHRR